MLSIAFFLSVFAVSARASRPTVSSVAGQTVAVEQCVPLPTALPIMTNTTEPSNNETNNTNSRWLSSGQVVRGVNLGSQFIIEPWMAYDEFKSMGCEGLEDEWSCVQKLGQEAANAAFAQHWNTWITHADIIKIASSGLNVIRIPVGFWIREVLVGPWEHYPQGGLVFLDRLVGWAADAGLKVIIDLHGGPGSQSSNQSFTGHKTEYPEFYNSFNYERALSFLEWMATRIHTLPAYRTVGILQVMNEPVNKVDFPKEAADMIQNFSPAAYTRIRAAEELLGIDTDRQLKIQYMSTTWGSGNPSKWLPENITNVLFDDHRYYAYGDDAPMSISTAIQAACQNNGGGSSTIVGEWSLSLKDGVADPGTAQAWYREFWRAQVQAYERTGGWIFWTWKCNWIGGGDEWRWCYESAILHSIIPESIETGMASTSDQCA